MTFPCIMTGSSPPGATIMQFNLAQTTSILARTPNILIALLDGLPDEWSRAVEGPATFSPFDVVGHLIDGDETDWIPRAKIILAQGSEPRFEPYDRFRHRARNVGRTLDSLLAEFSQLRGDNLQLLSSWQLTQANLELPGLHPSLGRVTLRQLLAAWVVHDLGHLAQVERVMAKQYRDEVGPWVPFLPILTDHEIPRS
jgi:DinB family protein